MNSRGAVADGVWVVYGQRMTPKLLIAPSILSADMARFAQEIEDIERAGADWVHVDVMDGRFVPNITLGPPVVASLRPVTKLPLDVHLMIVEPERYLSAFAEAGADIISVHVEACTHLQRTLAEIRKLGKRAGVVLNPHTSESSLEYVWEDIDLVLVMSVNPGFGGQKFLPAVLPKIERLREQVERRRLAVDIEVDGGISPSTIRSVVSAGANVVVAGAAVLGQPDRRLAIEKIRAEAQAL